MMLSGPRKSFGDKMDEAKVPHLWFAWYPVCTTRGWVWWDEVWRKDVSHWSEPPFGWGYRHKDDGP